MRILALLLLAFLTIPIGQEAREALSSLTNLTVIRGTFTFVDKTNDVAIKAVGRDQFQRLYPIRCRWFRGLPIRLIVGEAREEI